MNPLFIHALADVQSAEIGNGTRIWQFVVMLPGTKILRYTYLAAPRPEIIQ